MEISTAKGPPLSRDTAAHSPLKEKRAAKPVAGALPAVNLPRQAESGGMRTGGTEIVA
jgi:hypothetical protein